MPPTAVEEMNKDQRLRKSEQFAAARDQGSRWSSGLLVLEARRNGMDVTRFGFSVGKRVGNAVVRNRVKRRLREATRLAGVEAGWDLVFIARKDAASADFDGLNRTVTDLLKRARVRCRIGGTATAETGIGVK